MAAAPTGLDLAVALRVAEIIGADPEAMLELLPAAEAGMVAGLFSRSRTAGHQ
ncbi:MAG: hypothetical protein U1E53_16200 [Dongiaceae bacterium]